MNYKMAERKLILLILLLPIIPVKSEMTLHYEYAVTKDKQNNQYLFRISFTDNYTIYQVNITIGSEQYSLTQNLNTKTFYTYLGHDIQNERIDLSVYTSIGHFYKYIQVSNRQNGLIVLDNDIVSYLGFLAILGLLTKFVLFYQPKNQNANNIK